LADRSVVATVELGTAGVFARGHEPCGARPVAHDTSMPDRRCRLRESRVTSAASRACLLRATGKETSDSGPGQPGALAMTACPSADRSTRLVVATSAKSGDRADPGPSQTALQVAAA
jgi:hypothetical protein